MSYFEKGQENEEKDQYKEIKDNDIDDDDGADRPFVSLISDEF